jgi:hypothetical protein
LREREITWSVAPAADGWGASVGFAVVVGEGGAMLGRETADVAVGVTLATDGALAATACAGGAWVVGLV